MVRGSQNANFSSIIKFVFCELCSRNQKPELDFDASNAAIYPCALAHAHTG